MEIETDISVEIGNFTIRLNENGSISIYAEGGALVVKPNTGNSVTIYTVTSGRDPQINLISAT